MTGIIGKNLGMTQIFRDSGKMEAVTAIEAGPCRIIQVKTAAREGYNAVQLGFGPAKHLNSPQRGHLKDLGQFRYLREFRVDDPAAVSVGDQIEVNQFQPGDFVNVTGISKGKGFAGTVKRHHFAGGPKTHGQSDRHRAPGSIGAGSSPGRVLKGRRMAGHMGNRRVTALRLEICQVDQEHHRLLVKGAVPGAKNGLLMITKVGGEK